MRKFGRTRRTLKCGKTQPKSVMICVADGTVRKQSTMEAMSDANSFMQVVSLRPRYTAVQHATGTRYPAPPHINI